MRPAAGPGKVDSIGISNFLSSRLGGRHVTGRMCDRACMIAKSVSEADGGDDGCRPREVAGWIVDGQTHHLKVRGSNPLPATTFTELANTPPAASPEAALPFLDSAAM